MEILFWLCLAFICYTYAGYPLLIHLISHFKQNEINKSAGTPPLVSIVLTVRNESSSIRTKLSNLIEQSYPAEHIEIIVVSDGSEDGTEKLAHQWIEDNNNTRHSIHLIHYEQRKGKPFAVNEGVSHARGEIVVFADVRQRFSKDAILQLAANFSDPAVGCVSGELLFKEDINSEISSEMGAYWKYEKWIRKTESRIDSMVGATGSIYAVRRDLFAKIPQQTLLDDVYEPMSIALKGYRVIFDDSAQAFDIVSKNVSQEWKRKVRTLAGNWQLFSLAPHFFSPVKNPLWWKFLSHKIFRLIVPFALVGMLVASTVQENTFYRIAAFSQIGVYLIAISAHFSATLRRNKAINLSYFFLVLNFAILVGFYYWATGKAHKLWTPAYSKGDNTK